MCALKIILCFKSSAYGVISNYTKIMGLSNSRFQVDYENCRDAFK